MEIKLENMQSCFSANAKRLRKWAEYTQHEFAIAINIPRPTIGAIEEMRTIGIENVYKYSLFFNVSMNDLVSSEIDVKDMVPLVTE